MAEQERELFEAIKDDDLGKFRILLERNEALKTLRFGRFPILSLSYLYKSHKIIKSYEKQLIEIGDYVATSEPSEVFLRFKEVSKKSLRLYVLQQAIVTPLEMLAILEESARLGRLYKSARKSERITSNIATIYDINHNQKIKQQGFEIVTKRKQLSKSQIIVLVCSMIVAITFAISFPLVAGGLAKAYGDGSEGSPYAVYSTKQFLMAIEEGNSNIILKQDIVIDKYTVFGKDFSGKIDGGGKKITLQGYGGATLFGTMGGKLANINFYVENFEFSTKENHAIVTSNNTGEISGVNINMSGKINAISEKENTTEVVKIAGLAVENNGAIKDCSISVKTEVTGNGKENFYSSTVGLNKGVMENIEVVEGSYIKSNTVDIAGITYINAKDSQDAANIKTGTMKNCINRAELSQYAAVEGWSPAVSGVVFENQGNMEACANYGKLNAETGAASSTINLGGLVVNNFGTILKSENNAELFAKTSKNLLDIAGISAYNYGTITKSLSRGIIRGQIVNDASSEYGIVAVFAGGISGENYGIIEECFSGVNFEVNTLTKYVGAISALVGVLGWDSSLDKEDPTKWTAVWSERFMTKSSYFVELGSMNQKNAIALGVYRDTATNKILHILKEDDKRAGVSQVATIEELLKMASAAMGKA